VMEHFATDKQNHAIQFMNRQPNPIYTEVFQNEDFAASGYWFGLKSASAHGFDVKIFDQYYVYIRSTELTWSDNTTLQTFYSRPADCLSPEPDVPRTNPSS
jgi:hypothetical protein